MGFSEYPETDELDVVFSIIKVYSLRGLVFEKESEPKQSTTISFGSQCIAVVSQSLNDACKSLIGDIFTDDEPKWMSDKKTSPPFLVLYFSESSPRKLFGGYRQEIDGQIHTYNQFPKENTEILRWETDIELQIITAITARLSSIERPVEILPIDRAVFGKTEEGKTLLDTKLQASAFATVSHPISATDISTSLSEAEGLFKTLTKDLSRHFYSAENEGDRVKKFLGYFMFVERLTHSTFKSIKHEENTKELLKPREDIEKSANRFFAKTTSEAKNLNQRFHWCAITTWSQLSDQDVDHFLQAKNIRDKLSHGENIADADLPIKQARSLALKLLGTKQNN